MCLMIKYYTLPTHKIFIDFKVDYQPDAFAADKLHDVDFWYLCQVLVSLIVSLSILFSPTLELERF